MSFFEELKRRKVIRVAVGYVVIAWVIAQVAELSLDTFNAPDWVIQSVLVMLVLGLPLALFFAWAFELTQEGIKKEKDVDPGESTTEKTGRKVDFALFSTLVIALVIALAYFIWGSRPSDQPVVQPEADQADTDTEIANVMPAADERSVAVLPFANRSRLDDDLFFTDGIHDDLLTQLAKIKDLKTISRTTMMQYRGTDKDIAEIAKELGVAKILEGGVQRAAKEIRVNVKLFDAATNTSLWADSFDREMTVDNLFDIQSEITRQIVTAVKGQLTPAEERILGDKPTNSLAAWEAYSRARELIRNSGYNPDTYRAAEPLLQQAVTLDPDFYQAQAKLVEVLGLAYWIGYGQTEDGVKKAEAALQRATDIAPQSAEALAAQGHYLYRIKLNYIDALAAYQRALAAKPGDSDIQLDVGYTERRLGRYDDSVESMLRAYDADPGNVNPIGAALETMLNIRKYDRVGLLLPGARNRFPEETDLGSLAVSHALRAKGDVATARAIHAKVTPNGALAYFIATRDLAWMERHPDAAIDSWQRPEIQAYAATDLAYDGTQQLEVGWAHKLKGDEQEAIQWWDNGIDALVNAEIVPDRFAKSSQLATHAQLLALRGDSAGAIDTAREAISIYPIADDPWEAPSIHFGAWRAIAMAGERDEALENIRQLLEMPSDTSRWQMQLDPRWDFFRDDERFRKLVEPVPR